MYVIFIFMSVCSVWGYPEGPEEGLELHVVVSLLMSVLEMNSGPLKKANALSITEPFLQLY